MGWWKRYRLIIVITALAFLAVGAGMASFVFIDKILKPHHGEVIGEKTPPEDEQQPLDSDDRNEKIIEEWLQLPRERNLSVVIDNDLKARPQAGLKEADIVYEFPIEGGRARFMALYSRFSPQLIGPIRSARDYNIILARENDSIFVHAGGSPQAFNLLNTVDNLNGLAGGVDRAFWRVNDRTEPSNLYSDSQSLRRVASQEGFKSQGQLPDFKYLDYNEEFIGKAADKISIEYGDKDYRAEYLYDKNTKNYLRFTAGVQHWNTQGQQLTVKNIIIQMVNTKLIDDEGRLALDLDGQGRAMIFVEGQVYQGFWQKKQGVTKFFKAEGEEIAIRPGNTWINIVPVEKKVTY